MVHSSLLLYIELRLVQPSSVLPQVELRHPLGQGTTIPLSRRRRRSSLTEKSIFFCVYSVTASGLYPYRCSFP